MKKISKITYLILAIAALSYYLYYKSSLTSLCNAGEYYSDYTQTCEIAVLQLGVGEKIKSFTLEELGERYPLQDIVVPDNPAYQEKKTGTENRRYRGFSLKAVIQDLVPKGEALSDYVLAATCLDGFDPVMDISILEKLDEYESLIAIEELSIDREGADISKDGKWELLHLAWGVVSPGPFYIVWDNKEGTYWKGWPLQLKSLRIIKAKDYEAMLTQLKPEENLLGLNPPSEIESGYNQFRGKCLTCHSLNGVGGKKANVDLLEKFKVFGKNDSLPFLKAIIRNPPAGMTDILDIKIEDKDIAKMNAYLRSKSAN